MKIHRFISENWQIILIVTIALFLRFYNIENLTTFGGDQGYDFLVVKHMVADKQLTLLGPKIGPYNSQGNLYLGPAYYFMLSPVLFLSGLDPIGPALFTATLSLGTILIVYFFCKDFISKEVALISSTLFSFSSFLINQSRASSNPHLIPFFSALAIYSTFKILNKNDKNIIWPSTLGICIGIAFQLHYLGIVLMSLLALLLLKRKFHAAAITVAGFIITLSPQIIFELRHQFFVTNLFINQIKNGQNISEINTLKIHLSSAINQLSQIFFSTQKLSFLYFGVIVLGLLLYLGKNKKMLLPTSALFTLTVFAIIAASIYSGSVEPHYLALAYPPVAILTAISISCFLSISKNIIYRTLIVILLAQAVAFNILNLNLKSDHGYTMPKGWNQLGIKNASWKIANDLGSEEFNIASTLDGDTRARPLRYMTEVYGKTPQAVEKYPESQILYVVTRDEEEAIKRYTVWEVASFQPFRITSKWQIQNGIKLYKLEHI